MPVLSELIADVEPSVSVERRRFTIAFARASICVPSDRIVVTTAGSPVGIAEIANAIAAVKTVWNVSPRERLRIIEIATAAPAMKRIWFVSFASWRVSGVVVSSSACSRFGDVADLGRHARRGDDELAGAAGRVRVHEHHVGAVAERHVVAVDALDALRDRHALARERRLGDLERRRVHEAAVGGDDVAGLDRDDVARNELLGRKLGRARRRGAPSP